MDTQGEETAHSSRKQGRRCLTAAKGPGTACPPIATYWSVCAIWAGRDSLLILIERPFFYPHQGTLHFHGRGDSFWAEWLSLCHACFPNSRGHLLSTVPSGPGRSQGRLYMLHTAKGIPFLPSPFSYSSWGSKTHASIHKNAYDCLREGQIVS